MLFNSLDFVAFFLVVTALYWALPWRWRWKMLLLASCAFYMAFIPAYIVILFATIVIDYAMGIFIERAEGQRRRTYLVISILATCLVLFAFKYYNFFAMTVRQLQDLIGSGATFPLAQIILPIGLSFHTFQSLSYVIEVYRGHQKAERNFGIYSLYVMFYPQLVAGPIERPQNLLHQFYEDRKFHLDDVVVGLRHIGWGFFKKMVIADRAAVYVNNVYGEWSTQRGLPLLLATLFFAVQIYADFSGYSSIAIGTARVMGFRLMRNFHHPYFASSVSDFWRRWHISLSTWFKDYVYISLGGSRVSLPRHYANLLITFTVSGLWHGANWTYVVWGFYNGFLLVTESLADRIPGATASWMAPARRVIAMVLVIAGWVFFRAESMTAAASIFGKMFTDVRLDLASLQGAVLQYRGDNTALALVLTAVFFIVVMFAIELVAERNTSGLPARFVRSRNWQAASAVLALQVVALFGILRPSAFIYFQF